MQPVTSEAGEKNNIIWVCWLQGEDKAPEIVKACLRSMRKYADGYEIRMITSENMFNYVELPNYIIEKYQSGKITFTHFSDILRTCLLYEYGGIWIDATVLLTDALPEELTEEPFFVYQNRMTTQGSFALSSWVIAADSKHPILKVTRDALFAYWKKNDVLCDYFLFHLLFTLVVRNNLTCRALFASMPYVQNVDAHMMQGKLYEARTEKEWERITKRSTIHKLTRKFPDSALLKKEGTYYDYIVHHLV